MNTLASLNAAALKTHFGVYGYYYQLMLAGQAHPCRSLLELVAHHIPPPQIPSHGPDLLVIMMNPGSSQPLDARYQPPKVGKVGEISRFYQLVPARPDTTQYQIMRIMATKGFVHARIMNLSDLRQAKSPLFLAKVTALSGLAGGEVHSLFCPARQGELHALLPPVTTPVIVGWGRHQGLIPLAKQCLRSMSGYRIIGTPVAGEPALYGHPSPMLQRLKEQWLADVLARLEGD